ncbi:AbrB/MazE/SpoVT family DNA-binding domain-containing protein [Candidatus Dependentiae bacterium]|nr:AbrB/MazE/SpoVT family DNA-binding domain-containing protein [Candidatus Dependentiae bacterium]
MNTVAISPKYQVVIPKEIRKKYELHPGQKIIMIPFEGRIEMVLEKSIKSMRGFLKGITTDVEREDDRI